VVKGTISLVSNTTTGVFDAATSITRSIGRGVASLSMDDQYRIRRERVILQKNVIFRPLQAFGIGIFYGVSGIFVEPYQGAKKYGTAGLIIGIGAGSLGLATKPLVGVLDAASHTGASASKAITNLAGRLTLQKRPDPVQQWRLAQFFGLDGRLSPYIRNDARGAQLLRRFHPGTEAKHSTESGSKSKNGDGSRDTPTPQMHRTNSRFSKKMSSGSIVQEEECEDFNVEQLSLQGDKSVKYSEVLVLAEFLQCEQSLDLDVVIVSDQRILVVKAVKEQKKFRWSFQWELFFEAIMEPPQLDEQDQRSLSLTFTVFQDKNHIASNKFLARMGMATRKVFIPAELAYPSREDCQDIKKITASSRCRVALARIHNACCCLLGYYEKVIRYPAMVSDEPDESGVSKFGLWEFSDEPESKEDQDASGSTALGLLGLSDDRLVPFVLEGSAWHPYLTEQSKKDYLSQDWLAQAETEAIQACNEVKRIMMECVIQDKDTSPVKTLKSDLWNGIISEEDFFDQMECIQKTRRPTLVFIDSADEGLDTEEEEEEEIAKRFHQRGSFAVGNTMNKAPDVIEGAKIKAHQISNSIKVLLNMKRTQSDENSSAGGTESPLHYSTRSVLHIPKFPGPPPSFKKKDSPAAKDHSRKSPEGSESRFKRANKKRKGKLPETQTHILEADEVQEPQLSSAASAKRFSFGVMTENVISPADVEEEIKLLKLHLAQLEQQKEQKQEMTACGYTESDDLPWDQSHHNNEGNVGEIKLSSADQVKIIKDANMMQADDTHEEIVATVKKVSHVKNPCLSKVDCSNESMTSSFPKKKCTSKMNVETDNVNEESVFTSAASEQTSSN